MAAMFESMTKGELQALIKEVMVAEDGQHRKLDDEPTPVEVLGGSMDAFWLLYAGTIVFLMQAGFAMLEAGCLREKNIKNIMLKNVLDPCIGTLAFWSIGYGICYGDSAGDGKTTWVGDDWIFLGSGFEDDDSYHGFFFQLVFAATAATIVSGAVAERCQMTAYACYSFFLCAWVYPVVVHAIWSGNGFISGWRGEEDDLVFEVGTVDFAGCGVVHMVGGLAAFVGAAVLGPRAGRFVPGSCGKIDDPMPGHNAALVVLGTFILWFGWYGFNPGSTLCLNGCEFVMAKTAVTTTLAAASGCISNLLLHYAMSGVL